MIGEAMREREARGAAPSLVRGPKSSTPYENEVLKGNHRYTELLQDETTAGKMLIVKHDEWSDEYTATLVAQTLEKSKPPTQRGDRWTDSLTGTAKRKIEKSAKYMAWQKKGFRTFFTLTFDEAARAEVLAWDKMPRWAYDENGKRIDNPERKTVGKKITAMMNGMQQRHRKGLTLPAGWFPHGKIKKQKGKQSDALSEWREVEGGWQEFRHYEAEKIAGNETPFEFIWVIENPKSAVHTEHGPSYKENMHAHVLMNWAVKKDHFRRWAGWIERLWGSGYVKLERIRIPKAAAAYMAKAANYIAKGSDGTQGEVRGNRYSISKNARAPKARHVGIFKAFNLWDLIKQAQSVQDYLNNKKSKVVKHTKHGPSFRWVGENKEEIYFHKWGFGAAGRDMWRQVCKTLKACGFRFEEKEKGFSLAAVKFSNDTTARRDFGRVAEKEYMEHSTMADHMHYSYMAGIELVSPAYPHNEYSQYASMAIH